MESSLPKNLAEVEFGFKEVQRLGTLAWQAIGASLPVNHHWNSIRSQRKSLFIPADSIILKGVDIWAQFVLGENTERDLDPSYNTTSHFTTPTDQNLHGSREVYLNLFHCGCHLFDRRRR